MRGVSPLQLRASLERAMTDKAVEMQQATQSMAAAQADAAAQEELAELAKGELAEFQRRMAAEVEFARREALKSVEGQAGGQPLGSSRSAQCNHLSACHNNWLLEGHCKTESSGPCQPSFPGKQFD